MIVDTYIVGYSESPSLADESVDKSYEEWYRSYQIHKYYHNLDTIA